MPEINPDNHQHTIVTGPSNGLIAFIALLFILTTLPVMLSIDSGNIENYLRFP